MCRNMKKNHQMLVVLVAAVSPTLCLPNGPQSACSQPGKKHSCELKTFVQCIEFKKVKRGKHLRTYTLPCLLLGKHPCYQRGIGKKFPTFDVHRFT